MPPPAFLGLGNGGVAGATWSRAAGIVGAGPNDAFDLLRRRRAKGRTPGRGARTAEPAASGGPVALRVQGVPGAAELGDVVAEDLAAGVVYVEVERLALVGDLAAAVAPLDRAE
jgi:hypothetical protein